VFAGTVNHGTYLRDETGGRRFWPVVCGRIDVEGLGEVRDQLWAEAKARYESGCPWWLDTPDLVQLASDQQEARYDGDPWEEVIGPWLESKQSTAISEVLQRCIDKPQAQWTQTDKIRAARCLRAQGWLRYRERQGNRLEWRYRRVV
jgi:predicted P-loop ATPase